jgi:hypothetical protein
MNFNYFALHYLNLWLTKDREFCEALEGYNEARKLHALAEAAAFYKVARNLPKAHDVGEGLLRYKPVLDVIDVLDPGTFQEPQLIQSIKDVRSQISERYRGRGVTSLTTKFLWLKMKSPIIIYDRRARKALRTKPDDLDEYYSRWREEFNLWYDEIAAACALLPRVHEYSAPDAPSPQAVEQIASQPWFKERVFDVYLWSKGN